MATSASAAQDTDLAAEPLRRTLADRLVDRGLLDDRRWRRAVETVPRHRFVPGFYEDDGERTPGGLTLWRPVTEIIDRDHWLQAVYTDKTLITQFDGHDPDWNHPTVRTGGAPTSSSTLPSLAVRMWTDADLDGSDTVLEIGTGTGYSTALACERLGDDGEIVSVEVDARRLDQAAKALYGSGCNATLAVADGLYGYWPRAPYDRIVAACSVRAIPDAWLAQTRFDGKILATLGGWLHGCGRALLTVHEGGTAEGPLLPGTVSFMAARTHAPPALGNPRHWDSIVTRAAVRPTRYGPDHLNEPTEPSFFARFLAQLAAPNAQLIAMGEVTYIVDAVSGSVACLSRDENGWQVRQGGPVALWDTIENALTAWDANGRPGPETFHMVIDQHGQRIRHQTAPELSFPLP